MTLASAIDYLMLPNTATCPTCGLEIRMALDIWELEHTNDGRHLLKANE